MRFPAIILAISLGLTACTRPVEPPAAPAPSPSPTGEEPPVEYEPRPTVFVRLNYQLTTTRNSPETPYPVIYGAGLIDGQYREFGYRDGTICEDSHSFRQVQFHVEIKHYDDGSEEIMYTPLFDPSGRRYLTRQGPDQDERPSTNTPQEMDARAYADSPRLYHIPADARADTIIPLLHVDGTLVAHTSTMATVRRWWDPGWLLCQASETDPRRNVVRDLEGRVTRIEDIRRTRPGDLPISVRTWEVRGWLGATEDYPRTLTCTTIIGGLLETREEWRLIP